MNMIARLASIVSVVAVTLLAAASWPPAAVADEGKSHTVLITGANRGIGLELARQLSEHGWQVIGTARKPDAATELKALDVKVLQLDVTDQGSVERLAESLQGQAIDMLVNNAGIFPVMWKLADVDFDDFNRTIAVNTVGPVRVTQALIGNLRAGSRKTIVNVTSNLGSLAENTDAQFYGYRESKAALNMFTRSLAAELGPEGFTCFVLHPGWVQTDMGGSQAPLTVQESVNGIRRVLETVTPLANGTYLTWEGTEMPW
jgi:NAD(P)-dependent dehydrogenase (short-subunit alcohol dehydrogenase family)